MGAKYYSSSRKSANKDLSGPQWAVAAAVAAAIGGWAIGKGHEISQVIAKEGGNMMSQVDSQTGYVGGGLVVVLALVATGESVRALIKSVRKA